MISHTAITDPIDIAPPTATEAERALLGAVFTVPDVLDHVIDIVGGDDFHDADFGTLFVVLQTLRDSGFPVGDPTVLLPELRRQGVAENIATVVFVADVCRNSQPAHAVSYAKDIRRAATLRRQLEIVTDWQQRICRSERPHDLAAWVEAQLSTIDYQAADPIRRADEIAADLVADLRRPEASGRRVMTGLPTHDQAAGAWMPGELIILAARPGVGKTALALQVAEHNARRDRPVLLVSLEMRDQELIARMLCGAADVNSRRLRAGRLDRSDVDHIDEAAAGIGGIPLRIWAPPWATLPRIRAGAKREATALGLDLLVVDYIGLVRPDDRTRPRHEQVAEVSAGLKALAKELQIPVLALCQLNREADGAEPKLSHLRESGAIEQDADIVVFIHRTEKAKAKLIIAKHRHGETGAITLRWEAQRTRFVTPETSEQTDRELPFE